MVTAVIQYRSCLQIPDNPSNIAVKISIKHPSMPGLGSTSSRMSSRTACHFYDPLKSQPRHHRDAPLMICRPCERGNKKPLIVMAY